ncbi:MAG: hypothetical protein LBG90_08025 [Spirochaetaceae bacterium]|jgi:hypothetical protein|nr:hypothetical protein [Spirochaetaceae bacterium]
MKKCVYGAIAALIIVSASCASKPKAEPAPEPPKPYALPLTGFTPWELEDGTAELVDDTIVFAGGGLKYLLPTDVDLSKYTGLYLVYETSEWDDPEGAVEAKTGVPHRMQLSFRGWDGIEGNELAEGTDYTYPILEDGAGEVSIIDRDRKFGEWESGEAAKGFTLKANTFENDGIANYKVKITALELRPVEPAIADSAQK